MIEGLSLLQNYALKGELPSTDMLLSGRGKINGTELIELSMDFLLKVRGPETLFRYSILIRQETDVRNVDFIGGSPNYRIKTYHVDAEILKTVEDNGFDTVLYYKRPDDNCHLRQFVENYNDHSNKPGYNLNELEHKQICAAFDWIKNNLVICRVNDHYFLKSDEISNDMYNLAEIVRCMDVGIQDLKGSLDDGPDSITVVHRGGWESDIHKESEGTRRIIELGSMLIPGSEGKTFVVDELNRKLHPELTRRFIELFVRDEREQKQLIFTTHESRLLTEDLFRRDQIWFVRKTSPNISSLVSLTSIDPKRKNSMWDDYVKTMNKQLDRKERDR